jgi:hypothetical protein
MRHKPILAERQDTAHCYHFLGFLIVGDHSKPFSNLRYSTVGTSYKLRECKLQLMQLDNVSKTVKERWSFKGLNSSNNQISLEET